jgi:hypothetical protein
MNNIKDIKRRIRKEFTFEVRTITNEKEDYTLVKKSGCYFQSARKRAKKPFLETGKEILTIQLIDLKIIKGEIMKLKELKPKEYFKRKKTAKTVYIKGHYDRKSKRFSCIDTEDINREIFLNGNVEVIAGIELEY